MRHEANDSSQTDAERGVIQFLLLKPDLAHIVFERLNQSEVFTDLKLQRVFRACHTIYVKGHEISLAEIRREFEKQGTEKTGFLNKLVSEIDSIGPPASPPIVEGHINILMDRYHTQQFKDGVVKVQCFDDAVKLSREVLDWDASINPRDARTPSEIVTAIVEKQLAIYEGRIEAGYSWGLFRLDDHLCLEPGKLYVIGGIKKGAKTHFLLHTLDANLVKGNPCCLFSLEMNDESIYRRLLAKRAHIDSRMIHSKKLERSDFEKLERECESISGSPFHLHVDDNPSPAVLDVVARTRRWKYKNGLQDGGIVAVDFLQLLRMERQRNETEAAAIKFCAYELARMAKDLGVAVIAVAQLRNEAEGQEPRIGLLEGSGAIAQAAEAIILIDLVRRRDPHHESEGKLEDVTIIIAEQRSGESGIALRCKVDLRISTFYDTVPKFEQAHLTV